MNQYIFGYGSLIDRRSRCLTVPDALQARPAVITGLARRWNARSRRPGPGITYLGADFAAGAICNGVLFGVDGVALANTDRRESGYTRERLDPGHIRMLDGTDQPPAGDIWIYIIRAGQPPDAAHPIVQSYLDICLNGCLEIEAELDVADFAAEFIRSTQYWSAHWINDRIHPRRPQSYVTQAYEIDALLHQHVNPYFTAIQIE